MSNKYTVAVVQAAPVLFDVENSLKKAAKLVDEAAQKGSKLILFPEAFISAYPRGLSFGTVVGSRSVGILGCIIGIPQSKNMAQNQKN